MATNLTLQIAMPRDSSIYREYSPSGYFREYFGHWKITTSYGRSFRMHRKYFHQAVRIGPSIEHPLISDGNIDSVVADR